MSRSSWSVTGSRQRPHSAATVTTTVPVTSTPSMTDSSRRSSSTGEPAGTRTSSRPQSPGASIVRWTARIVPGRRPSSRVSSTRGARGSSAEDAVMATVESSRTNVRSCYSGPGSVRERAALEVAVAEHVKLVPAADLGPALLDGLQRLVQDDFEVGQVFVDIVVDLHAHPLGVRARRTDHGLGLPGRLAQDLRLGDHPGPLGLCLLDDPL